MCAGMFAKGQIVPVPGAAALVVMRNLLHTEGAALSHFRRHHDARKIRAERQREIDNADRAGGEGCGEARQGIKAVRLLMLFHRPSSRSRAFGLSRKRASQSCAISPG